MLALIAYYWTILHQASILMEIYGSAKCQQRLRCKKSAEASAGPTLKHDDDNHVASGLPQ